MTPPRRDGRRRDDPQSLSPSEQRALDRLAAQYPRLRGAGLAYRIGTEREICGLGHDALTSGMMLSGNTNVAQVKQMVEAVEEAHPTKP
jgi:hypothetical protein